MNLPDMTGNLSELNDDIRRLIDVREGIQREITTCQARLGEKTKRCEDRLRQLKAEYSNIQQRILEIDRQIRAIESGRTNRTHTEI